MTNFHLYLCVYSRQAADQLANKKSLRIRPVVKPKAPKPGTPTPTEEKKKVPYTTQQYFGGEALKNGKHFLTIGTDAVPILPAILKSFIDEVVASLPELMAFHTESDFDSVLIKNGRVARLVLQSVGHYKNVISNIADFSKAKSELEAECQRIVPKGQDFVKVQIINTYCSSVFNSFLKILGVLFAHQLAFMSSSSVDETMFAAVLFDIGSLTGNIDVVDHIIDNAVPVEQPAKPADFSMSAGDVAAIIAAAKQAEELKKQKQAELLKSLEGSSLASTIAAVNAAAHAPAQAPALVPPPVVVPVPAPVPVPHA
jgi:hypothetical protein